MDTHSENTASSEGATHTLLIYGPVELKQGWRRQKRYLFLFNDLLLMSNTEYVYYAIHLSDYHKVTFPLAFTVGKHCVFLLFLQVF